MSTHSTAVTARVPTRTAASKAMIVIERSMAMGIMSVTAATVGGMDGTSVIATMVGEATAMIMRVADPLKVIDRINELCNLDLTRSSVSAVTMPALTSIREAARHAGRAL